MVLRVYLTMCNTSLGPVSHSNVLRELHYSWGGGHICSQLYKRVQNEKGQKWTTEWPYIPVFQKVLIYAYCSKVIINGALFNSQKSHTLGGTFWGHPCNTQRIMGVLKKIQLILMEKIIKAQEEADLKSPSKNKYDYWRPFQTKGTAVWSKDGT